ncbi:Arl3b [Monocercomonoides exilis]|uniref:Arl3b n=1 Tax=Monocercomonoides exilis TaxID=2049356 RepID=UPI00355A2740|nr:Arl3b [Monocercomonoides exilis]|eukprot:MONOS_2379.1-p1 / transcript=MONOS_2379.1 / gene=MONOS_2379 / organism=Monocercomonoides_exilis_PA203 / gene_product=Arl3b / transcript_product=Arl3b / location=Mono_scaffold00049:21762-22434(+) / protein_length=180 / sequence_SO=supercontig / SO=protein_coding / is_pseudo=false
MGFLSFFFSLFKPKKETLRLLFLGLDNAGKTTILNAMSDLPVQTVAPTQGFNMKTVDHSKYQLKCWDLGGQKSIRQYWKNYFGQTDGFVFVVDAADSRRLEECGVELQKLLEEEKLSGLPLLVYANKMDLPTAMKPDEVALALDLYSIRDRAWQIQGCSAIKNEGLQDGIGWLVTQIKE